MSSQKVSNSEILLRLEKVIYKIGFNSQKDFIKKSGIGRGTFYDAITGKKPPSKRTEILIMRTGVNPTWLFYGKGEPLISKEELAHHHEAVGYLKAKREEHESSEQRKTITVETGIERNHALQALGKRLKELQGRATVSDDRADYGKSKFVQGFDHAEVLGLMIDALKEMSTAEIALLARFIDAELNVKDVLKKEIGGQQQ